MHPADGVILAVILISILFGAFRGFVREAFAVAGWVLAYVVARLFHPAVATLLDGVISTPSLRLVTAWIGLFVTTLLLVGLVGYMIRSLMEEAGIGAVDRLLGGAFGLVRGLILVLALLILIAPLARNDAWWQNAKLPGAFMRFEPLGHTLKQKVVEAARSAAGHSPAAPDVGTQADGQR